MAHLAPHTQEYWGTDLSTAVIDRLSGDVEQAGLTDRVHLHCQPADSFNGLPTGHFDTVLINSVIQYFPDSTYLTRVIDQALDLLTPRRPHRHRRRTQRRNTPRTPHRDTPRPQRYDPHGGRTGGHAREGTGRRPRVLHRPGRRGTNGSTQSTSSSSKAPTTTNSPATATKSSSTRRPPRVSRSPRPLESPGLPTWTSPMS
ncbi:methyltransferase [Streptomyces sp. ST1020]|uniref:class I SAM-dependent methyltransferase n=1 Tax=Streptomyces sp. ST1020 TaxID=1848901 RepID=UPI0034C601F4